MHHQAVSMSCRVRRRSNSVAHGAAYGSNATAAAITAPAPVAKPTPAIATLRAALDLDDVAGAPLDVAVCDVEPLSLGAVAACHTKSGPYGHASTPTCSAGVKHVRPVAVPLTHSAGLSRLISDEAVLRSMRKAVGGCGVFSAPVQFWP